MDHGRTFATPVHDARPTVRPTAIREGAPRGHSAEGERGMKKNSCSGGPSMTPLQQTQRRADQAKSVAMPSRRDVTSTVGFAVLLMSSALCFSAQAQQQKIKKSEAKYQDKPNGDQHCQLCQFFQAPNQCQLVKGGISPNGWCEHFAAKT
jgi:hypothetical protein